MNLIHGNVDGSDEYESNRSHEAKAASKAALIPSFSNKREEHAMSNNFPNNYLPANISRIYFQLFIFPEEKLGRLIDRFEN